MRGGQLIREARLRAGLTQTELAERTGRERSVIARWEQGAVSPSVDNLLAIVEACGYDLPLVLIPRDTSHHETLDEMRMLSPERRLESYYAKIEAEDSGRG
jgi:transcriptional regulator with XRE-family HTH domain